MRFSSTVVGLLRGGKEDKAFLLGPHHHHHGQPDPQDDRGDYHKQWVHHQHRRRTRSKVRVPAPNEEVQFTSMRIPIDTFRLHNGLLVTLSEDHTAPIVAVNLWYNVGSANERAGRTGFAHLFEHMLFQGSADVQANEHFELVQRAGGTLNGSTWLDRTNYFETVPSNQLELALWLEANRMGHLLPAMTQQKLDTQRDVVKNERRWSVDNQPYGTWWEKLPALCFPPEHPFHHSLIGSMDDLTEASLDDIKQFFATYYTPDNAVLSIAGDFDPREARTLIERHFGDIARGTGKPPLADMTVSPTFGQWKREVVEDDAMLPRLYLAFRSPTFGSDDYYAASVCGAILGMQKGSRLYRTLVRDRQSAAEVATFTFDLSKGADLLIVDCTARPGIPAEMLEQEVAAEIDTLHERGVTQDEVDRAVALIQTDFVRAMQSAGDRADKLSLFATYFGDPDLVNRQTELYAKVTARDVNAFATERLGENNRASLLYVPRAEAPDELVGRRIGRGRTMTAPTPARAPRPQPGPTGDYRFPRFDRRTLSNGLRVVVAPVPKLPLVTITALVDAGASSDPVGQEGLAQLTAQLLTEGTTASDGAELALRFERLGASVDSSADWDTAGLTMTVLSKQLDAAFELASEVLLQPAFREREVERLKGERLAALLQLRTEPRGLADESFARVLYEPASRFSKLEGGNDLSVAAITRDDITAFFKARYTPASTTIIVVGDVGIGEAVRLVQSSLGNWSGAPSAVVKPSATPARTERSICLVHKADAPQTELRIGHVGVPRRHPDYFQIVVMNAILGGLFNSRINLNLREAHAYTYGAFSAFEWRRQAGPFVVSTAVRSDVTDAAVREVLGEIDRIREQPVASDELSLATSYLDGVFPIRYETTAAIASALGGLIVYELPDDYFDRYRPNIRAVTAEQVLDVARRHLNPLQLQVLALGDSAAIRAPLEALAVGPLRVEDALT